MPKMEFRPATRKQLKVKLGLMGTAGTGKTWNALAIAEALAGKDGRIAVIDSERGRAEAYAGDFKFDHLAIPNTSPETYVEALSLANDAGYDVIVVDSISHEWMGKDGVLASVDRFGGWKEATPRHDAFVEALFRLPRNVICTIRAKTQYQVEEVERDGRKKQEITKLGVGPVQRDNLEYEFDLLGMVELDHSIRLHKSVIASLPSGSILMDDTNPRALGRLIAFSVNEWINAGEEVLVPVDAPEAEIEYLRALLEAEGFDDPLIDNQFKKRRLELGALTEAYVTDQQKLSEARLAKKQVDIAPIQRKWGREAPAAAQNGDDAGNESPEAGGEPESLSEPQATDTPAADADGTGSENTEASEAAAEAGGQT